MSIPFDGRGPAGGVPGGRPSADYKQADYKQADYRQADQVCADRLEVEIKAAEAAIARLRAFQAERLAVLRHLEIYRTDGARSMRDWTAATLDVSHDTAQALLTASQAEELLEDVSFDRAVATARLVAAGGDADTVEWSRRFDISGVKRLVARQRRLTRVSEQEANEQQRVRVYPNFDRSQYDLSGAFNSTGGRTVELFLDRLADELPADHTLSRERRRAAGLVAHAEDYLNTTTGDPATEASPMGVINVHADADLIAATGGEAGAEIEFGPKIGPLALEELLCTGKVRIILTTDSQPAASTHATREIPSHTRTHVLKRDGGCTIAGCNSRYRLEPHHITAWSQGGNHHPDNLTTLCWYHHHVIIHRHGHQLDPHTPPQRRRLLKPNKHAPP